MKNFLSKIPVLLVTMVIGLFIAADVAHAQVADVAKFFGFDMANFVAQLFAHTFNMLQTIAGWALTLTGTLLNYSINLTLQIKDFLAETPAVFTTWKAIRDISGLFIIFFLLWAALKLILGLGTNFGGLIKNIVIAGVLINFSFFFASLGIDASNIVSIQLYNAIAPANSLNAGNLNPGRIEESWKDGGVSDIFMKSLKIPALYDTKGVVNANGLGAASGGQWTNVIRIMLVGVASVIIMITAALSFAAAALAFVIRFVVLIFLLAFSPIWFASHIVPEIGDYAKKWTNLYKGMLVFMPVYLFLMYLALNVITTTKFLDGSDAANIAAAFASQTGTAWYSSIIGLAINAVIVIMLLNFPLVAAISIGGGVVKFINTDKLGAAGMWRMVGRNTIGRGAYNLRESKLARSLYTVAPGVGTLVNSGLSKGASLGFGDKKGSYEAVRKSQIKAHKDMADQSKRTDEEVARIINQRMGNDARIITTRNNIKLAESRIANSSDPAAKQLAQEAKDRLERDLAEMEKKYRSDEYKKAVKSEPAEKIAKQYERGAFGTKPSKFGKAVAAAIRKEKKPADEIMEALGELKSKDGGGGEKKA